MKHFGKTKPTNQPNPEMYYVLEYRLLENGLCAQFNVLGTVHLSNCADCVTVMMCQQVVVSLCKWTQGHPSPWKVVACLWWFFFFFILLTLSFMQKVSFTTVKQSLLLCWWRKDKQNHFPINVYIYPLDLAVK